MGIFGWIIFSLFFTFGFLVVGLIVFEYVYVQVKLFKMRVSSVLNVGKADIDKRAELKAEQLAKKTDAKYGIAPKEEPATELAQTETFSPTEFTQPEYTPEPEPTPEIIEEPQPEIPAETITPPPPVTASVEELNLSDEIQLQQKAEAQAESPPPSFDTPPPADVPPSEDPWN